MSLEDPRLVKQEARVQVFEAPEVETQQKVSVLEEAVAASEHGKEPSGWFPPPLVVAAAERGARL